MQTTNTAQTVYNYLLHNSSNKTAAQIAAALQLTVQQVNSILQNLQQRKLVVSNKQQHSVNKYSAVVAHNVKFNAVRKAKAIATQTTQQRTLAQYYATQLLKIKNVLNKIYA